MLIFPHTLSVITTHQCTAACDHCCFGCTPHVKTAIPEERLRSLMVEARDIASLQVVVFTGGECFLLGSLLDELIASAKAGCFITRCVTNGYWATSEQASVRRVERLVSAGLDEINFSTGDFHARDVPVDRVIHGARACLKAGITTLINVELHNDASMSADTIFNDPFLKASFEAGKLRIQRNIWIENGGEHHLSHRLDHSRFNLDRKDGCKTALNVVAVTPTQDVMACCGLHMEKIPELRLGSLRHGTLAQILRDAPDDLLKIWIHVAGPERVLEFVKEHSRQYQLPLHSVHPCETCLHLYKDQSILSTLTKHSDSIKSEVLSLFAASVAHRKLATKVRKEIEADEGIFITGET